MQMQARKKHEKHTICGKKMAFSQTCLLRFYEDIIQKNAKKNI